MWCIHTIEYYSAMKKEWNLAVCDNMDGARGYYAKWNKSKRERQIVYNFTYIWNLKNKTMEQNMEYRKQIVARGEGSVGTN